MPPRGPGDELGALFVDQYQLTMAQAYLEAGIAEQRATFSLFVRALPTRRGYLLLAGIDDALEWLERLRFRDDDLEYLRSLGTFSDALLEHLATLRFRGDVRAMPEGTPFFPDEPVLEVDAPILQAQLAETCVMNLVHAQTVLATKAARVVTAAAGRPIVELGVRRGHLAEGGVRSARALYVAGIAATSDLAAGARYGIPVAGTMAHSFVQAFDHELDAFRAFATTHPDTTLLVDTYDTREGVRRVIALARELGDAFRVRALRLDSGDLGALARDARRMLDEAGLERVEILASGGLDEDGIAELVRGGSPIDGFGVGTALVTSDDAPTLEMVYKLVEHAGRARMKRSPGKRTLPGRKQVFRRTERGEHVGDVIARHGEELDGAPLLREVMRDGQRVPGTRETLDDARRRAREEIAKLPARVRGIDGSDVAYPVALSAALAGESEEVERWVGR